MMDSEWMVLVNPALTEELVLLLAPVVPSKRTSSSTPGFVPGTDPSDQLAAVLQRPSVLVFIQMLDAGTTRSSSHSSRNDNDTCRRSRFRSLRTRPARPLTN